MAGWIQSLISGNTVLFVLLILPVVFQLTVVVLYTVLEFIQKNRDRHSFLQ